MSESSTRAYPRVVVQQTVIFEVSVSVAETLAEMFCYGGIDEIYTKNISGSAIPAAKIKLTVEAIRNAIAPALRDVKTIDQAIKSVRAEGASR